MWKKFVVLILTIFTCNGHQTALSQNAIAQTAKFKQTTVNQTQLPKKVVFEGDFKHGLKWTDNNGENILIISEKLTRPVSDAADFKQHIYAYQYVSKNGSTKLLWKIYDFAENYCDAGKGLISPVYLQDIDNDGVAENMFVYQVQGNCDVSPESYKLMMHSGATKLAIRGSNNIAASNMKISGEKKFDSAFDTVPAEFKRAASAFWDESVKDFTGR